MPPELDLSFTIALMMKAHSGQVDKGGRPYHLHPLCVMARLKNPTPDMRHAALLHDVIEDTEWTMKNLTDIGYSVGVLALVDLLTRLPGASHRDYVARICLSENLGAIMIKLADVEDNSCFSRFAQLPEKDRGMMKRYVSDRASLREALERLGSHYNHVVVEGEL